MAKMIIAVRPYINLIINDFKKVSLLSKADIKLTKFLNGVVSKLSRADAEKLFEILFQSLFTDSNKSPSNHGFKIYIQLLVKHSSPFELANTSKVYFENSE